MDVTSIIDCLIRKVKRKVEIVQQEIIHHKYQRGTLMKGITRSDAEENEITRGGNKEEKGTEKKEHVSSRKRWEVALVTVEGVFLFRSSTRSQQMEGISEF